MPAAPTAAALVEAAKTALGVTTDDELARALDRRYGIKRSQSTVNRWKNLNEPGYEATMALLDAAGWLNTGGAVRASDEQATTPDDLRAEVGAALRDLAKGQAEILRRLPLAEEGGQRATRPKRS